LIAYLQTVNKFYLKVLLLLYQDNIFIYESHSPANF